MLEIQNLTKTYTRSGRTVCALDALDLRIDDGDFVVLHGPSGSGKSTLLLILGGMLRPDAGTVTYRGDDIYAYSRTRRNRYRRSSVGFVFQKFYLVPYLTVQDNIRLPLAISGDGRHGDEWIASLTERLGIADRLRHFPAELSVGEQQRVAMARMLAGNPDFILADEPTGNLDTKNTDILAECLEEEHRQGRTVILATHNESLMERGNSKIHLVAGHVQDTLVQTVP